MNGFRYRTLVAGAFTLLFAATLGTALAQVKKGKTRPAATSHLMKGLVKPHTDAVKKGLEAAAISDEGWQTLAIDAALLSEVSFVLMDDGRSPDKVWADAASKTMREGSAALIKAVEAKDQAAAKAALGAFTKSCKGCHDAHKAKK